MTHRQKKIKQNLVLLKQTGRNAPNYWSGGMLR